MKTTDKMNDAERIAAWSTVNDPLEALQEIAAHQQFMSDDPYYRDLNTALWEMVERVLSAKPQSTAPPQPDKPIRLIPFHRDVLQQLFEDEKRGFYSSLRTIAVNLQSEHNKVRLACRALKRKGLSKQVSWFDQDDGSICGSGYGITPAGIAYGEKQGWKGGDA